MRSQICPAYERTQCRRRPPRGDSPRHLRFLRRARRIRIRTRTRRQRRGAEFTLKMPKIRSKLARDHVRLSTLASGRVKFQKALVDDHAEPVARVGRRVFGAIGVRSQTRHRRRRTALSSPGQESAQEASLWHERLDEEEDKEESAFCAKAAPDGSARRGGRRDAFSRVAYRGCTSRRRHGGRYADVEIS